MNIWEFCSKWFFLVFSITAQDSYYDLQVKDSGFKESEKMMKNMNKMDSFTIFFKHTISFPIEIINPFESLL